MRALGIDWLPDRAGALFSLGANQRQTVVEWTYRHGKTCFGGGGWVWARGKSA
jgi:hypothetical protein